MTLINTALIGYGPGGRTYNAPMITSVGGFSIKKVLSSSTKNVTAAQEDFPAATVVTEISDILKDPEIQLVCIVLPNYLHYEYARKALEAGKHVIVEKPFTTTVAEADSLIEIARQKKLVLTVNHNRRWDSDYKTVKKIIRKGTLGKVVEYEAHFDRFRNEVKDAWKEKKEFPGGGILYDLGSHLIDQALMLFGQPKEVFADIRIQREGAEVADNFELLLFYPNLKVTLKAGMLVKGKGATYTVHGTHGSFLKYGADVQEEALKQGLNPKDDRNWGREPKAIWGKLYSLEKEELVESEAGDYSAIYRNLYSAISGTEDLLVKPEQAREVIKVIELAYQSNSKKGIVKYM